MYLTKYNAAGSLTDVSLRVLTIFSRALTFELFALACAGHSAWGACVTNSFSADAFVRAAAPTFNYGGAGALSVSGANATNGQNVTNGAFDSFVRFNSAGVVTNFDSMFGTNNWVINGARLRVTEVGAPNNAVFNRGTGSFEVRWIADNDWTEGTGRPNAPTMDGISYSNEVTLLNSNADLSLGTFTNAGVDGTMSFWLELPAGFLSNVRAGTYVGLFLTASDSGIGFTFNSRDYQGAGAQPDIEISAVPRPGIASVSVTGADVVLACTNGTAGGTYYVLSTTNLAMPPNQWQAVGTNFPSYNGDFAITLTNTASGGGPGAQFFMLQTQ